MRSSFLVALFLFTGFLAQAQFKLYEQGIDAYQKKDYTTAIRFLEDYMDRSTRDKALDVDVHYYLALSYFKTNSYTSSVREFDEALQLGHKNTGNIHWFMAKAYAELKAYQDALAEYGKAISLISDKPSQGKLFYERALVYDKMINRALALEDLQNALTADPTNVEARNTQKEWGATPPTLTAGAPTQGQPAVESKKVDSRTTEKEKKPAEVVVKPKTDNPVTTTQPLITGVPAITAVSASLADQFKGEKRYALVIGNSKYQNVSPLRNAENDANDMAAELEKLDFEVFKLINGDYNQMRDVFKKFHEKLATGPKDQTVGLFYYAGHGIQNQGENYLVPVEANVQFEDDIPRTCFPVQRIIMANMERSNSRINILILDACRNNPFPSGYRSADAGLAEIRRAKGSFIAYATAPGSVASDGEGRNGLYTQELLNAMRKPGLSIEQVFKEVRRNVLQLSGERQYTWDSSNIIGDFYFKF